MGCGLFREVREAGDGGLVQGLFVWLLDTREGGMLV